MRFGNWTCNEAAKVLNHQARPGYDVDLTIVNPQATLCSWGRECGQ